MKITEELIEQTYQFCYKRLSNPDDARDLAQDILCEALQAVASGRNIIHFQGWFWQMARNRYAVMLNRRNHKPTEYLIDDYLDLLVSESEETIDDLIMEEELSRMHAVIAKMAAIHRDILVEYYIREHPIKIIAENLDIPEGTVKRRLFDAKHAVKKEMLKMPRVTELSYIPHELELWTSAGWDGIEVFRDLLGRQILASCYQQGRSIPELSETIQVASVYLEDKMYALEQIGLLKRVGKNRYLTNFLIFPRNVINEMLRNLETVYTAMCETAYHALIEHWDAIRAIGFYGMHLPMDYLNTIFLPMAMNWIGICCVEEYHKYMPQKQWKSDKITVFEDYSSRRLMGQIIPAGEEVPDSSVKAAEWRAIRRRIDTAAGESFLVCDNFCTPPFQKDRSKVIHGNNVELLCALSRNPDKTLSAQEEVNVGVLMKRGIIAKRGEEYHPEIVIFQQEKLREINCYMKRILAPESKVLQEALVKTIQAHLFPHVREDLLEQYYHYVMEIFMVPVSYMVSWGQENHLFATFENSDTCGAGICIIELQ
ncbi:MAG: RNA polymerase sigma factor [Lachnospiraceae bacterium]|nr:RNA polymerase sigma factor [Lachnospiraceae bacterium]